MILALNLKKWGWNSMFKKILISAAIFLFVQLQSFCSETSSSINSILNTFNFDKDSVVSISIKDKGTNKVIYEKHPYKYLNPASTLKLYSMAASYATLGSDYSFDMSFYKDKHNNIYLKLSGDPLFSEDDAEVLAKNLKAVHKGRINKIFIDDSIIDKVSYPDGWTVDDYWPNAPKISPYMIDNNTVKVDFYIESNDKDIRIIQKNPYKFSFINKLQKGDTTSINFVQDDIHNTIDVEGTISKNTIGYEVPVLNPKYFFCKKLNDALNKSGITFHDKFLFAKIPDDVTLVAKFSRPIDDVVKHTLYTSDNLAAEMVFKVAGGKYAEKITPVKSEYTSFGTTQNGINMFIDYYDKLGMDTKNIKLRDGSGVSRYNVLNTEWMTKAISKMDFDFEKFLPTSDEGTLCKRMREMKDNVFFKTGTLYGVSSLAGIIKSGNKEYSYASIIMSYNRSKSVIKGIEDEIVYEVYRIDSK